ncbi:phage tail protein [Staphylococcus epidermidis]|uniref:major tail protein n=2 Tax=Staphylococcus epidermidis TaxID=1282 RepID=UPI001F481962|nr:major tail protein [Staphylococcus epidermidis]MCE5030088.1 phage tail protein [Staphylococcus epidermidis]MCE5032341.1 phage tail protein [Staphylococcus epidermidis]
MAKKMTSSFTGLDYFHYKILNEDAGVKTPQRIEGLQEITISKDQEVVKAHGDNRTMETAVSNGDVELESGFHTLDLQTKADLFGLESQDGIYAVGNDTPNDVACILVRTNAVGREIVGLLSGKFVFSEIEGETQSDDIEFSSQSTTGTFIPVDIEGYDQPKAMLMGFDKKGETTALYSIWKKVFGEAHPEDGSSVTEPVEENTGA